MAGRRVSWLETARGPDGEQLFEVGPSDARQFQSRDCDVVYDYETGLAFTVTGELTGLRDLPCSARGHQRDTLDQYEPGEL